MHTHTTPTFVTTGATGHLGGRIARRLSSAAIAQTLLVRTPSHAPDLPAATTARASFGDHDAVRRALTGADRVLMVSASETPDRLDQHRTFVDAAADAGVGHLVYISFYGAAPDATFHFARDHWYTEQHIRSSGVPFTFLRDNLYADFMPSLVGPDGVIRGPGGKGRVAAVAQDDIADAAMAVLTNAPEHTGATYDLTGPQALTFAEIAQVLSRASGRPVSYHEEDLDEARRSRASYGAPDWEVEGWISTYTAVAAGELAGITDDVTRLTGRPAKTLAEVVAAA